MKPGRNLSLFLEHLAAVGESGADFERAADTQADDCVKFMSIHKSKGLEFPVVILIYTSFGGAGNSDTVVLSDGLPPGVKCYDPEDMTKRTTLAYEAAASSKKFIESAESLRVLYVALTRAREHLIMIGSVGRGLDARMRSWALPKKSELLYDKPFLDILAAAAVRVKGCGITDEVTEADIPNVYSEIIPASALHHDKQKRKDAVLEALRDAAAAPYPEDAFDIDYKEEAYIPAKTSATALISGSPVKYRMEDFGDVPDFMREEVAYDAAARGTFTHTVMQFIDFMGGANAVRATIDDLTRRNILPEDAGDAVDIPAIEGFLRSGICKRITASEEVKRELPFVIRVKAKDVYSGIDSDREILVQGIIDLCFVEDGQWVLVDYKTNRLDAKNTPEELLTHYSCQLEIYKRALAELTGRGIKEAGIYFLSPKEGNAYYTL